MRHRSRAERDIDLVLLDLAADLGDTLERALGGEAYQGFSFRRKGPALVLDNGAVNVEIAVTYRGQPWTSISVDIARAEAGESDVEWVKAIVLTEAFGVTRPAALPCLPLRFHVAQKLHGLTLPPRRGKQNERFRPGRLALDGSAGRPRLRRSSRRLRTGLRKSENASVAAQPERHAAALG